MLNESTDTKVDKLDHESRMFMEEMRILIHKNPEEAKELGTLVMGKELIDFNLENNPPLALTLLTSCLQHP